MQEEKLTLPLQGMICRQCEDIVCQRLLSVRGVIAANASYWKGEVVIEFDPDLVTEKALRQFLASIGYPPSEKTAGGFWVDIACGVVIVLLLLMLELLPLPDIPTVDNGTPYLSVFLSGVVTGTHCMVMCGGIMLSQRAGNALEHRHRFDSMRASAEWNLGRVIACAILGLIFGAAGGVITYTTKLKSFILSMAGFIVTIMGIRMWGIIPAIRRPLSLIPSPCSAGKRHQRASYQFPFLIGMLTGLMPCGALYAMWLVAMTAGSAAQGGMVMFLWSLGTVPLMLILSVLGTVLPPKAAKWMNKANVVIVVTLGLRMSAKGLRLL